ncbi:hypothetical protein RJ639_038799 [Escallonia herrerae]|uniref:Thioredoxin domain-containing protein n=1 Tax=Escallonia herrerae TaxID=1293975 RepID=A0AA89B8G0_9ASTE|nr:hypothetical protein RJ639_038799 [Escallonia herrerae]
MHSSVRAHFAIHQCDNTHITWSVLVIYLPDLYVTCSIFSRHGIHSVPSILMVNQKGRVQNGGPKDLRLDPIIDLTEDQVTYSKGGQRALQSSDGTSLREISTREPYLLFSILFLSLKALQCYFPAIVSRLTALWTLNLPHLNFGIFGESRQLVGRGFHLIDVKRVWSKLKLYKSKNFHSGAKSARVWASSLASVSFGEMSSARASPS